MPKGLSNRYSTPVGSSPDVWRREPSWKPILQGASNEAEATSWDISSPKAPGTSAMAACASPVLPIAKREAWCDIHDDDMEEFCNSPVAKLPSNAATSTPSQSTKRADRRRKLKTFVNEEKGHRDVEPTEDANYVHLMSTTPSAKVGPTCMENSVQRNRPMPPPPPPYSPRLSHLQQASQQEQIPIMSTSPMANCQESTRPAIFLPPGALGYRSSPLHSAAPRSAAGFDDSSVHMLAADRGTPAACASVVAASPKAALGTDASARTPMSCRAISWAAPSPVAAQSPAAVTLRVLLGSSAMVSAKELAARLEAAAPEIYDD